MSRTFSIDTLKRWVDELSVEQNYGIGAALVDIAESLRIIADEKNTVVDTDDQTFASVRKYALSQGVSEEVADKFAFWRATYMPEAGRSFAWAAWTEATTNE
jgi:hypothetical protein